MKKSQSEEQAKVDKWAADVDAAFKRVEAAEARWREWQKTKQLVGRVRNHKPAKKAD